MLRCLNKQLKKLDLPLNYELKFFNEETDQITSTLEGHVIYIKFIIEIKEKEITKIEETEFYCWFNDDYPFSAPVIINEELPYHPLIDNNGYINLCDWSILLDLRQIIGNLYCITEESFNNDNKKIIF